MQGNKRVYPRERASGKGISYLLLFLSVVVLLAGLVWRGNGDEMNIQLAATPTPIPTGEAFDETMDSREITLPAHRWYALQLGVFESEKPAEEIARRFKQRGAAGYIWQDERFRVLAAIYPTKEDAQNVRKQLSEQHTIDTFLFQAELPSIQIRMRGMRGQLDMLEAGFIHANDLIARLQEISVMMDRQEKNVAEATELLEGLRGQTETVSLRLQQRFAAPRHQTVQGLIDCFSDYAGFFNTLESNESAVSMAMKVKHQAIQSLHILKTVYDGLSNT